MPLPELLLPRSYDPILHEFRCLVTTTAGAGEREVYDACKRVEDKWVRDMRLQGYTFRRLVGVVGPKPYHAPTTLPKPPAKRRYAPGEPHPNREAEYRDRMDAVQPYGSTEEADTWQWEMVGEFSGRPFLVVTDD